MGRYDALYQSSPPPLPTAPPTPVQQHAVPVKPVPVSEGSQPVAEAPTVREHRSDAPNDQTDAENASLLDEITEGAPVERRQTERYSFEIYTDQKPQIEELQYLFKQRTGTKLSSSRLIREAIAAYLPEALRLLAITDRPRTPRSTKPSER